MNTLRQYDEQLFLLINNDLANPLLDGLMSLFSTAGDAAGWIVFGLVAIVVIGGKDMGRNLLIFALTMTIAGLVLQGGKRYFDRERPIKNLYPKIQQGEVKVRTPLGPLYHGSFPSGHSQASFTAATFFALYFRKYWTFLFMAAGAVAFSRVYLGAHYPADVLVGSTLGWLMAFIVYKIDPKAPDRA